MGISATRGSHRTEERTARGRDAAQVCRSARTQTAAPRTPWIALTEAATTEEIAYVLGRYRAIYDGGGDPEACLALGDAYRVGTHLPADPKRANELYAKACNADHPTACNNLGAMLAMGPDGAAEAAESTRLYAKACNLGSREGCLNAGIDPATAAIEIKNR